MKVQEAVNRGVNFFGVGLLAAAAGAVAAVAFTETDWADRADDIVVAILALIAVGWYLVGSNRFHRSFVPLTVLVITLIIKAFTAAFGEADDPTAQGDDIGITISYFIGGVLLGWQLYRWRSPAAES
ncbi:MAG: hypothetical protein M1319_00805 [Chloroflexi bacterium]|nr:hypothetical protein [Chloroflexota bacterium]